MFGYVQAYLPNLAQCNISMFMKLQISLKELNEVLYAFFWVIPRQNSSRLRLVTWIISSEKPLNLKCTQTT